MEWEGGGVGGVKEYERWREKIEKEREGAALGQENMSRCSRENECYKQA